MLSLFVFCVKAFVVRSNPLYSTFHCSKGYLLFHDGNFTFYIEAEKRLFSKEMKKGSYFFYHLGIGTMVGGFCRDISPKRFYIYVS